MNDKRTPELQKRLDAELKKLKFCMDLRYFTPGEEGSPYYYLLIKMDRPSTNWRAYLWRNNELFVSNSIARPELEAKLKQMYTPPADEEIKTFVWWQKVLGINHRLFIEPN